MSTCAPSTSWPSEPPHRAPDRLASPGTAVLNGVPVQLGPLCEEIADRYFERFPEDLGRYGNEVARAWEIHDTRHVLNWAVSDVEGRADLNAEITWLARVLEARNFPLEHLATNLELTADVTRERIQRAGPVAERLEGAADLIRRTPSFQ